MIYIKSVKELKWKAEIAKPSLSNEVISVITWKRAKEYSQMVSGIANINAKGLPKDSSFLSVHLQRLGYFLKCCLLYIYNFFLFLFFKAQILKRLSLSFAIFLYSLFTPFKRAKFRDKNMKNMKKQKGNFKKLLKMTLLHQIPAFFPTPWTMSMQTKKRFKKKPIFGWKKMNYLEKY